jgi:hypothetical protein
LKKKQEEKVKELRKPIKFPLSERQIAKVLEKTKGDTKKTKTKL